MEIAAHLKLNREVQHDRDLLDKFLATLTSDDNWDSKDQKQAGYKAMGLKRYAVDWTDTVIEGKEEDVLQESATTQTQSTASSSQVQLPGGSQGVVIKVESPEWLELARLTKVLVSGEAKIIKATSEMQKLKLQLAPYTSSGGANLMLVFFWSHRTVYLCVVV
jgi:hypothetical protein